MSDAKQIIFLGGPFSAALTVTDGHTTFDPRLKGAIKNVLASLQELGYPAFSSHAAESFGLQVDEGTMVQRDYQWIKDCDIYIALLPLDANGCPYRTDGTFVEIALAVAHQNRVLMVIEDASHRSHSYFIRNLTQLDQVRVIDWDTLFSSTGNCLQDTIRMVKGDHSSDFQAVRREEATDPISVLQRLTKQSMVEEVEFKEIRLTRRSRNQTGNALRCRNGRRVIDHTAQRPDRGRSFLL